MFPLKKKASEAANELGIDDIPKVLHQGCRVLSAAWRLLAGERPQTYWDDIVLRDLMQSKNVKRASDSVRLYAFSLSLCEKNRWIFHSQKRFSWLLMYCYILYKRYITETQRKLERERGILKYFGKHKETLPLLYAEENREKFEPFL